MRKDETAAELLARVWEGVTPSVDGCWECFAFSDNALGHKKIHVGNGKYRYVHRIMYEAAYGPIPEGLELDHLCRNPSCCRPDHLEAVTHQENIRRGREVVECAHGHPYTPENTILNRRGKGFHKICRTCNRQYRDRRNAAMREKRRQAHEVAE